MAADTAFFFHVVHKEGNHSHVHYREIPHLVDRDKDHIIPCGYLEIGRLGGLDADREENRAAARRGNAEIGFPLGDIIQYLFGDPDLFGREMAT